MKIGQVGGHVHNVALRFDLQSAVPRGAEVQAGTLQLHYTGGENANQVTVWAQPVSEEWTDAASWNRKDGTDRWSEPGGDFDHPNETFEYNDGINATAGTRSWHSFAATREWVSGKRANHGILLRAANTGNGGWFVSSNDTANPAKWPVFEVRYSERLGEARARHFERQQLSDRISLGVNVSNGNLMVRQTDFSMPGGLGPGVAVSRTYNSLDPESGSFGPGWKLDAGHDVRLVPKAGERWIALLDRTGAQFAYERRWQDGTYQTPAGRNDTLTRNADHPWTLTEHKSQTKQHFAAFSDGGRLLSVEDRNGRKVTMDYGTGSVLRSISDSNNNATLNDADDVRFTFASATQLGQMTDPAGRVYGYGYDTTGRLASYTDPQNGTSFKTLYEYNGPDGKLSKITTPQGNRTVIEYFPAGHEHAGRVKAVTRVTNTTTMTGPTPTFSY